MANSGKALTSALAPYLNGPFGFDVAARVLRSALAHYSELNAPELLESCREILDESGLSPDAQCAWMHLGDSLRRSIKLFRTGSSA